MQGSISQNCVRQSHLLAAWYMLTSTMTPRKWDRLPSTEENSTYACITCLTTACTFSHFYLVAFCCNRFFSSSPYSSIPSYYHLFFFHFRTFLFFAPTFSFRPYFYGVQICTFFVQNKEKKLNSICIKKVRAQVQICFTLNNFIAIPFHSASKSIFEHIYGYGKVFV